MSMDVDSDYTENVVAKKAPVKPKAGKPKQPLQPIGSSNAPDQAIEDIYQKKSQLEHILLRPDTYIGSTEKQQQKLWVHDGNEMKLEDISYVPGLYKIFDEILVNAADNKVRDPTMDTIDVTIDKEQNTITVWNNGDGLPVEIHKEEKVYVPELIFGHLLTSSNYDDTQKKVTGGRNGYGAKLANIFSTEFAVETCDGKRQKKYKQVFSQNMSGKTAPKITACKPGESYTCVTFKPDLAKFGMTELEDHTVQLMRKRVYDLAGVLGKTVKVRLDGKKLPIKSFSEYVELYLDGKDTVRVHEKVNDRWEIVVTASQGQFQQVSFVNSVCTVKGGTHVNYVADQLTKGLTEHMGKQKDYKKANVKPFMVKNYLSVFVNCMIENPAFDSQTKETLTLRASSFGSKCELSEKLIKKVGNECGIINLVASFADFKNNKELRKGDGVKRNRITGQLKLLDANSAGGKDSEHCTLILTEGDSARSLVVSGLAVVDRNLFGVFPLRGKLLNVRDASTTQVSGNAEIQSIKQIMGLQHGKTYESVKSLRYGHLMIMTDQDHDGSHIKGLIMNFFHHFYPSLLRIPGFLLEFITPIVKATKGSQTKAFYTMPEYEQWSESVNTSGWKIKYYKGLGTSTDAEAQEYFLNIDRHRKRFVWDGGDDGNALELAFSKKRTEDRKTWLQSYEAGTFLDQSADDISYSDFVNKELILFSRADLERSIPSMVDGLKPGQRKILFSCFKKGLKSDIKVAQLAGYVSEHSAYHHGEVSLQSTIIGLAQNFVGSNNINLLFPSGQFGSRLQGGKDAASARYIFTRLEKITRKIYHEADDHLLDYLNEEGQSIEPHWYMPVLPMVLVNGAEGIGTGWSTFIPNFNPRDIVANLQRLLSGEELEPMHPWYKHFKGSIEEVPSRVAGKSYACHGHVSKEGDTVTITELPIRKWTEEYKVFLEALVKPEEKAHPTLLSDYKEHHTPTHVHFELQTLPNAVPETETPQLLAKFKLSTRFALSNMVLFDQDGSIRRYSSPEEILTEFFALRLEYYAKRRDFLIEAAEATLLRLHNQMRFILAVVSGELRVSKRKHAEIEADLDAMGFDRIQTRKAKLIAAAAAAVDGEDEEDAAPTGADFSYLLSMAIYSLTLEKVDALAAEEEKQKAIVEEVKATPPELLYKHDLDAFSSALDEFEQQEQAQLQARQEQQRKAAKQRRAPAKKASKKKSSSDSDDDSGEDYAPKKGKAAARKPASKAASSAAASASTQSAPNVGPRQAPKAAPTRVTKASKPSITSEVAKPPPPPPREDRSLMDRLAGRMEGLTVQQLSQGDAPSEASKPALKAPQRAKPARAPARKKVVELSDSSESEFEELGDTEDSEVEEAPPKAKQASSKAAVNRPAPKRKPNESKQPAKSAVSRLQQSAAAEVEVSSPPVVPQGKVRRIRPSPFHKGSGNLRTGPPPSPAPLMSISGDSSDQAAGEAVEEVAAGRPSRRAAAKQSYVEILSEETSPDEEDGSDFELSE